MKKIQLQEYTLPNNGSVYTKNHLYNIYLGNEQRIYFTSKKNMCKFIADTNRALNESLQNLNTLYSQVFAEYREFWLFSDYRENHEFDLLRIFASLDDIFNKAVRQSSEKNVFAFRNLFLIISQLRQSISIITKFYRDKTYYNKVRNLNYMNEQILFIETNLKNWGKNYNE